MTLDLDAIAARMYPATAPNAQAVPPIEAKATTEPAATKPAEPRAVDATTHPTADQTKATDQNAEVQYTLALPNEAVIETRAMERLTAFAKANHLSPAAAQQALNHVNAEVAAYRDQQSAAWTTLTRETWVNDVKHDPEVGGEKFTSAVADARRFIDEFGDEETRPFLDDTGFGNSKFLIRMLARAAKRMGNAMVVTGGGSAGGARDTTREGIAKRMYSKHT